ncbi:MAG TPA: mechanosensitive ion channel family protein [Candidatus Paceibacterota bacterium]|nr:mechanosensitive ion channel family protein [Verrucomicrobiota bacterium]HRY50992.1 mechanosensitive ion channel family protein [Candidatus Paceibacterota bacterium]
MNPQIQVSQLAEQAVAHTVTNSKMSIEHLGLLLDPLTKDELLIEAKAWRDLVKAQVYELSLAEIAERRKARQVAEAAKMETPSPTNVAEKQEEKQQILDTLTVLREERDGLLERLKTVLDAYEAKGGDPAEFRKYASAVSGIKVQVTDTTATWTAVEGWLVSKEGGIKWGRRLLQFLGTILAFGVLAWMVGLVVRAVTSRRRDMSDLLRRFLNTMARRLVLLMGLITALSMLGVNLGALLALVGGGAFIIGFALQDTLGNFAAGLMLLLYRPFDVGDSVELGSVVGNVDHLSLVHTRIRTFDNKVVLVPNKQVWGQVITNITGANERRVDLTFTISYANDVDKAQAILERIVGEHPLVLKEPAPTIELDALGESSVSFVCRPWAKTSEVGRVRWDITKQVKKEFDANGVTIGRSGTQRASRA